MPLFTTITSEGMCREISGARNHVVLAALNGATESLVPDLARSVLADPLPFPSSILQGALLEEHVAAESAMGASR